MADESRQHSFGISSADYLRALKLAQEGATQRETISIRPLEAERQPGSGASNERRHAPRYRCQGSVEFRAAENGMHTWATVTDISRTGCYVEMQATFPPGTAVDMLLDIDGVRARVKGAVRVTYPFLGMGIEFTKVSPEDVARIDELVLRLSQACTLVSTAVAGPIGPDSDILTITEPQWALDAVVEFFRNNRVLAKDQFLTLIRKSQKPR